MGSPVIPLHPTTLAALNAYRQHRQAYAVPWPATDTLFLSIRGTRLQDAVVRRTFRHLAQTVGLTPRAGSGPPRLHDLRHTFTVATLRDGYATGQTVASRRPLLSAYWGHRHPASTYWYIPTDPELLRWAMELSEAIPTVRPCVRWRPHWKPTSSTAY